MVSLLSLYFLVEIASNQDLAESPDERLAIDSRININEDLRSISIYCAFGVCSCIGVFFSL
jgi:hypothetical protein